MRVHALDHYNLRAPRALLDRLREFYCVFFRDPAGNGVELGFPADEV